MYQCGFVVVGLIAVSAVLMADEPRAKPKHDFEMTLQTVEKRIPAGARPKFRLTLKNVSGHPCRLLNFGARPDLQHTYCDLVVTKDGKTVDMPRAISDPGPIADADYLTLAPDARQMFVLSSFPVALDRLPPGNYNAYVLLWQDPMQSATTRYKSQDAKFTVRK